MKVLSGHRERQQSQYKLLFILQHSATPCMFRKCSGGSKFVYFWLCTLVNNVVGRKCCTIDCDSLLLELLK